MSKLTLLDSAAISLLQTANRISSEINTLLDPLDLTMAQLKILWILYQQPERCATVNQIKQQMTDPSSNVSRLLNKLMDKQWIIKKRDDSDQRIVHIHISAAGIENLHLGKKAMDKGFTCFNNLSDADLQQLLLTLAKL
ncbi:MAG: MarR family transcriptional regulator [Pseudomonadales bacterium]|nr:MarR family transcriptional regulator [Pseudomonadales bacterium]